MKKRLRIALVAAIIGGSIFVGTGPASATCRPEDKVPCDPEGLPSPQDCSTSFDPGLPVKLGVCDL